MAELERFKQCVRKIVPGDEIWNLRGPMEMPGHTWRALAVCSCEKMYADIEVDGELEQRTVEGVELKGEDTVPFVKPVWVGRVRRIVEFNGVCPGEKRQFIL